MYEIFYEDRVTLLYVFFYLNGKEIDGVLGMTKFCVLSEIKSGILL